MILNSSGTREDAERLGSELAGKGVPDVGVLDSDDFESLGPDSFVVFSGQYDSREQAERGARPDPRAGRRRLDAPDRAEGRRGRQGLTPERRAR